MPIGSPAPQSDSNKYKSNNSPSSYVVSSHQQLIRPELVRPPSLLPPPQSASMPPAIIQSGNTTSVIRIGSSVATTNTTQQQQHQQIIQPVIGNPTHLIPILPSTAVEKTVTKNGISTGSVYQWHTLLPVINAPSVATNMQKISAQQPSSSPTNLNLIMARPHQINRNNLNQQKHHSLLLHNNNNNNNTNNNNSGNVEMYEAEDEQGDDDVFETEPVKNIMVGTSSGINKNNNTNGSNQESNKSKDAGFIQESIESEAAAAAEALALNKRRTQSCSALQASKDPQSPLKVGIFNTLVCFPSCKSVILFSYRILEFEGL